MENTEIKKERAVLAGLSAASMDEHERSTEVSMEELAALVETAGGETVAMLMQSRPTPDARSFIGDGKVREMKELIAMNDCDLAVFDNELSPSQMRVLSEELGVKVLDRSGLILDIFAQRAQTREGQLQVELAQYKYLLPRLTGMWTHLVRQTASGGSSPIGTRGPGETQLETDRRHIRRKIQKLEEELADVRKVRSTQRRKREKNAMPVVALVGYTNAGKSTLLSSITAAKPKIASYAFTTLEPNLGIVSYHDGKSFVMADIPGIIEGAHEGKGIGIRFLRHIERNSVLLFMVSVEEEDIPGAYKTLLNELKMYNPELLTKQRVLAVTKCDLIDSDIEKDIARHLPKKIPHVFISSSTGEGLAELKNTLWAALQQ